jgi:NAD(P)-dependent dehydrogenase (short-subunit alcohol dehydrogenase family)
MKTDVVVITGATAGVGRSTVREFAKRGSRIGLLARDPERLEVTRKEVEALGGQAVGVVTDVSDNAQVEAAAAQVERTFGPIDVWINNAMVTVLSRVSELQPEEVRRVTEVTYLGSVYGTLAALRRMLPRDRGTIIQVGSALAYRSIPLQAAYCAAKHALRGFTDSLRTELIHDNSHVHLTMVQLPALNTPQFEWLKSRLPKKPQPVPPIYQPEVAARAIWWSAHHRRRELLVGGSTVAAIWGSKFVPELADHYLARNGFESQQTQQDESPDRANNLWRPVRGDYAAHGGFDARAQARSFTTWATIHRPALLLAGAYTLGTLLALVSSKRAYSPPQRLVSLTKRIFAKVA